MGKARSIFWLIILGLIVVVILQNQVFFFGKQSLQLISYRTPEIAVAIFFLAFFVLGLVVAYFFSLPERFRLKKTIKNLKNILDTQQREIEKMKTEPEPEPVQVPEPLPSEVPEKEQATTDGDPGPAQTES